MIHQCLKVSLKRLGHHITVLTVLNFAKASYSELSLRL